MKLTESISTLPIRAEQSLRSREIRWLTSGVAGKIIPLGYVELLREDRVSRGNARIRFQMMETAETLMNAVNVTVHATFVPFLAFDRFNGLDQLNRSYRKEPETEGGDVIPFFDTVAYDKDAPFWKTMGIHAINGANLNGSVLEAYNTLVNWRRRARSTKLPEVSRYTTTLASAFWRNPGMSHIVPDFDQAMMDGEVELNLVGQLPVKGLASNGTNMAGATVTETGGESVTWSNLKNDPSMRTDAAGIPQVFAELSAAGVTLSLSNIEMAKKTAAFAALRKQYAGHSDDYIIDLLMQAIRVPDAQLAQPILLDRKSTIFGYSKRYATDSGNLNKSVTEGETFIDLRFRTPPMNTGGIILITAEIVPEQMFERQMDHFLHITDTDDLPNFTRDYLDPEKVAVVKNSHVDVLHSVPDGTFGYAPLNHEWKGSGPKIGGKFMRQIGDPFVEDRQRIWAVETTDPTLTEDFYLVNDLHHNVFADTESDAFEITSLGGVEIVGNTVFGKGLEENTGDYDALTDIVDTDRIDQTA